jgi:tetratricopeptide (TPR) repeat protein
MKEMVKIFWDFLKEIKEISFEKSKYRSDIAKSFKNSQFSSYVKLAKSLQIELFEKLFISDIKNSFIDELSFLMFLSKGFFVNKDYQNSIKVDKIILKRFENDKKIAIRTLYNIASKYYLLQKFDECEKSLLLAIELLKDKRLFLDDVEVLRVALRTYILYIAVEIEMDKKDIAVLHKMAKDLILLLSKKREILRGEDEVKFFLVQIYVQISSVLMLMDRYDDAIEYCKDGLEIINEKRTYISDEVAWGIYYNLAFLLWKKQELKEALVFSKKAEEISKRLRADDIRKERAKILSYEIKKDMQVVA